MADDFHSIIFFLSKLIRLLFLIACPLLDPRNRLYWIYTLGSLALIFGAYFIQEANKSNFSFKKAISYGFPKELYTSHSAILDYQAYLINSLLKVIVSFSSFFIFPNIICHFISQLLQDIFGATNIHFQPTLSLRIIYTVLAIFVLDFSAFLSHYLLHKVPILWEFHKVHHSAEGLNLITSFRDHPVDIAFKQTFRVVFMGVFMGVFSYLINSEIKLITVGNVLISTFLFTFIINLRHSHIWISYGWHLSHVFFSPAMHQIHHSKKDEHIDKNLGLIFSFWDSLFGTLYVPKVREEFMVGLVEQRDYADIWHLYYSPFVDALRKIPGLNQTRG